MPIAYQVDMQVVFHVKMVVLGMVEEVNNWYVAVANVAVYDHYVALMVLKIVGMDSHRDYEQATSMLYHVVLPNCTIASLQADHSFRIEEVLVRIFTVETMVQLVCRIVVVLKMQKLAIYVHD